MMLIRLLSTHSCKEDIYHDIYHAHDLGALLRLYLRHLLATGRGLVLGPGRVLRALICTPATMTETVHSTSCKGTLQLCLCNIRVRMHASHTLQPAVLRECMYVCNAYQVW